MSFHARLVFAAAYLVSTVVLALLIPLALTVERRADSDFEAAVLGDAAILAARTADLVASAGARPAARPPARLAAIVAESRRTDERRILVTDAGGRVLVDSNGLARRGSFYATTERPEFRVALFRGQIDLRRRFSDSLGEELLLVTVPVVDRERVVGAVRVSASRADVEAGVRARWLRLALIGVAVIAAGLVLAWLLAAPLGRRVRRLVEASTRLGRGELDARAPRARTEGARRAGSFLQPDGDGADRQRRGATRVPRQRVPPAENPAHRAPPAARGDPGPANKRRRRKRSSTG